jgi:hypothetical protein
MDQIVYPCSGGCGQKLDRPGWCESCRPSRLGAGDRVSLSFAIVLVLGFTIFAVCCLAPAVKP